MKPRKHLAFILLALGPGWVQSQALAAKKPKRARVHAPASVPASAKAGVAAKKATASAVPGPAKTAASALAALKDGKFSQARTLAESLQKKTDYADVGLWLEARADLASSRKAFGEKKYAEARKLAERAASKQGQIEAKNPYSPFLKDWARELGLIELAQADALWGAKSFKSAKSVYNQGFQRLVAVGAMTYIPASSIEHYNNSCARSKEADDLCSNWIQRFVGIYPKRSVEYSVAAAERAQEIETVKSARSAPRTTQSYRAPDLDLEAFDESFNAFLEGKHKDAVQAFLKFNDEFPRSAYRPRARYWLATAIAKKGDEDRAKQAYLDLVQDSPLTFYGLASTIALTSMGTPTTLNPVDGTLPVEANRDPQLLASELYHLKRAEAFLSAKATELAALELRTISVRDVHSSPFLAYLARLQSQAGNHNQAFVALGELIQRKHANMFSQSVISMIFPLDRYELIRKIAIEEKVDPILAISLIKQESGFDGDAASGSGAIGLSQLMHATALDLDPKIQRAELLDPERNAKIGMRYLSRLVSRFNGNVIAAVAAYNAGPGAVSRWLKELPEGRGYLEFIETIPYRETREYVTSILRNYFWYSRRIGAPVPTSFDVFWVKPSTTPQPSVSASPSSEPENSQSQGE